MDKIKGVDTSVLFICKGSMEYFNLMPDRFSTVSTGVKGTTTLHINSLSFFSCVITVVSKLNESVALVPLKLIILSLSFTAGISLQYCHRLPDVFEFKGA